MIKDSYDVIIVGGGPAGLAAAVETQKSGVKDILIIEREHKLGGILRQCIHNGFRLKRFKESLTGPEYAGRFIDRVNELKIEYITETTVLSVGRDKSVTIINKTEGVKKLQAKAVPCMGRLFSSTCEIVTPVTRFSPSILVIV